MSPLLRLILFWVLWTPVMAIFIGWDESFNNLVSLSVGAWGYRLWIKRERRLAAGVTVGR